MQFIFIHLKIIIFRLKHMKIASLFFLIFFISQISLSQSTSIENPSKKTWKILIKNNKSAEENFTLVGKTILENDFSIDKKDKEFLSIQTTPKSLEKLNATYYLNFAFKDSIIILTGMTKINISINLGGVTSESSYDKIINKGMSGSVNKESFNAMLKFAKLIPESQYEFVTN